MSDDQMKRGIVIEGRGSQVRVQFEDNDGVISPWLDVVQATTFGAKSYTRPKPGSLVICAMDKNRESGSVIGAIYSDADPAPKDSHSTYYHEMDDGSVLKYEDGKYTIQHAGGAVMTVEGNEIGITGNMTVSYGGGSFSVVGNAISMTGNVAIQGDLDVTGNTNLKNTTINGINQTRD